MTTPRLNKISALAFIFTVFTGFSHGADTPDGRTWVWVAPEPSVAARHLELNVMLAEPVGDSGIAQFECAIRSNLAFRGGRVVLSVFDMAGGLVTEGALLLDIDSGATSCRISLDTKELAIGTYRARFTIHHTSLLDEPLQEITIRKVSSDKLLEDLARYEAQVRELGRTLDTMDSEGRRNPYLRLKVSIAADEIALAQEDASRSAWESLEARMRYVESRVDAARAGTVFGALQPELGGYTERPALVDTKISEGAFAVDGRPVYLFGGALPALDPEMVARLSRYQLNTAVVTLGPEDQPGTGAGASAPAGLQNFFDAAANYNVALAVQLAPHQVPAAMLQAHPELKQNGVVDIAQPMLLDQWEAFVRQIGPTLTGRPMLLGISLADDPQFHFDGEAVKAGFLDFLQVNYPDRLTLNRSWRAHLATLEDIVPWSTNPYDTYQEHRPYQFDWQTYHQSLGNNYFNWSRRLVEQYIPDMPLTATLANTVFSKGETRYGINREQLAAMLQISGCSSSSTITDPVYGMSYPEESAYYTLLKSFEPGQPVFNLHYALDPGLRTEGEAAYRYVHSAVWEGVMSGLSAAAVPMDSLVFRHPYALEAFATASLDINRLSPIVHAFQMAPTDVGILFSYASKVFDDGEPHLLSARNAYEGVSFGGYNVRFVSEEQCAEGVLDSLKILVLPDTPALGDEAFQKISAYVEHGGTVARTGAPIPYNQRGYSRGDLIRNTGNTVLVRGLNLPTEYLHAMDAATVLGALPQIPRPITPQGYPVEGLKSRYVKFEGKEYLFILNLRKEPVYCTLATQTRRGRDLIRGNDVTFPTSIESLTPMLLELNPVHLEMTVAAQGEAKR